MDQTFHDRPRMVELLLAVALTACAASDGAPTAGAGGNSANGGETHTDASTAGTDNASSGQGGAGYGGMTTGATGGVATSGNQGGGESDGSAGTGGGPAGDAGSGGGPAGGAVDIWYEAEAPGNTVDNGAVIQKGYAKCASVAATVEGATCASGGGEIRQLLGRGGTNDAGGGVTMADVTVPSAGMYDVTWWYHCGLYDNWHDNNCGGAPYPAWMSFYNPSANPQPGCRPHLLAVNGTQVDGDDHSTPFWQFPCFGGSWSILHAATTPLELAAGSNKIRIGAPHIADLDAVDVDAIHVTAVGKGTAPRILAPRAIAGDNNRK